MEQNPSSEVDSSSASQEISRIVWNPKARHSFYESPPKQDQSSPQPPNRFLKGPF
jgi:hypothetical protein